MKKLLKVLQAIRNLVALPIMLVSLTVELCVVQVLAFVVALLANEINVFLFKHKSTFELFKFTVGQVLKGNKIKISRTTEAQAYDPITEEIVDWVCVEKKLKSKSPNENRHKESVVYFRSSF